MQTIKTVIPGVLSELQKLTPQNTMDSEPSCKCGRELSAIGDTVCNTCTRYAKEIKKDQLHSLGGGRALETYTLENFKANAGNQESLNAIKSFNYKTDNIYLHGPVGSGKSHLAAIAARKYFGNVPDSLNTYNIRTYKVPEISRQFRSCRDGEAEQELLERIASKPLLVIEDFGVEKYTEFLVSLMYEIIDWRYQNNPTGMIITSNLSVGDLANKIGDERVASRLVQLCKIYKLSDRDHRFEGKK